jgi:hypothetical protein
MVRFGMFDFVERREYDISIVFNEIEIKKVIIDPHFELKHAESITDEIILQLVQLLNGQELEPDDVKPPYSYFTLEGMDVDGKLYKLVWLLEDHQIYIGVVNAYRR